MALNKYRNNILCSIAHRHCRENISPGRQFVTRNSGLYPLTLPCPPWPVQSWPRPAEEAINSSHNYRWKSGQTNMDKWSMMVSNLSWQASFWIKFKPSQFFFSYRTLFAWCESAKTQDCHNACHTHVQVFSGSEKTIDQLVEEGVATFGLMHINSWPAISLSPFNPTLWPAI